MIIPVTHRVEMYQQRAVRFEVGGDKERKKMLKEAKSIKQAGEVCEGGRYYPGTSREYAVTAEGKEGAKE